MNILKIFTKKGKPARKRKPMVGKNSKNVKKKPRNKYGK